MADKRSFSKSIVTSDKFIDMPHSARSLYFMLGLEADDDGFVDAPKKIMRSCEATAEDLARLVENGYIINFDSGVVAIRHWKINNYIPKDRYKTTTFQKELSRLTIKNDGSYSETGEGEPIETVEKKVEQGKILRALAKKNSDLPTAFEQQIRNAFKGDICPMCGVTMLDNKTLPTIQHNIPLSLGGKHELDNISVICRSCNSTIRNSIVTPAYNTQKVKEIWEKIQKEDAV